MSYCSVVFLVCMWFPEAGITGSTGSVAVHNLWTRKGDTYCNDTCTKSITHSEGYEKVSWVFPLSGGDVKEKWDQWTPAMEKFIDTSQQCYC